MFFTIRIILFLFLTTIVYSDAVILRNGKVLQIVTYTVENDQLTLHLEGGGEIVCPLSSILRIERDREPENQEAPFRFADKFNMADRDICHLIENAADKYKVDVRLVAAIISVESNFNARAVSPKGAKGLMQLMPDTASRYNIQDIFDPAENIEGGIKHLKGLMALYRDDLDMVLAAYNAGEKAVEKYHGIPPYAETRDYVSRVLNLYQTLARD